MSLVLQDRVRETTAVTGTGSATLLGAVTGYQAFSVVGNANTCYYTIADQSGPNWEVGIGTYSTSGPTLARTTVLASSNSGSLVNFTSGTKDVFLTYPSENAVYTDENGYLAAGGLYNITLNGNLTFNGTGNRIRGDFANATRANRPLFQNSTTNAATSVGIIPNGTSVVSSLVVHNAVDPDNSASGQLRIDASSAQIRSDVAGTGTSLPLTMFTGGSERLRIDTSGNVGIGTSTINNKVDIYGSGSPTLQVEGTTRGRLFLKGNFTSGTFLSDIQTINNAGIGVGFIRVNSTDGSATDASSMTFGTSTSGTATERMRIDSSGRLLIGTTSASGSNLLQVTGDASISGLTVGKGGGADSVSTAVGSGALATNSSGVGNSAFGRNALTGNTTGSANNSFGRNSLLTNTTGSNNVAVGNESLFSNTTASNNTAVGYQSGYSNTTGTQNAYLGYWAGYSNTTGIGLTALGYLAGSTTTVANTAIGSQTMQQTTTGTQNVAVGGGYSSIELPTFYRNTTGSYNTVMGWGALASNTTASNNTAVGYQAAYANTTGTLSVALGANALRTNTTGDRNHALGYAALYSNTTGNYNTGVGYGTLYANTTGGANVATGYSALAQNTTGGSHVAMGYSSLSANTTGENNTAIGRDSLFSNTTASNNTAVGYQAGYSNLQAFNVFVGTQAGYNNANNGGITAVGYQAGYANGASASGDQGTYFGYRAGYNTSGNFNTALGSQALLSNTTASYNTAVGYQAGYSGTTADQSAFLGYKAGYAGGGANCVAIGSQALRDATGGSNTAVGEAAMILTTTGYENTAIGRRALYTNSTGNDNVAVGMYSLYSNTTASNNTAIGYQAGYANTTGTNNLFLGFGAGSNITTGTNNIYIGGATPIASGVAAVAEIVVSTNGAAGKGSGTGFINPASGGVYQGNNSTLWSVTSDARLKKNIVDNNTGLDKITAIQVRNFEYRTADEITEVSPDQAIQKTGVQLGAIAQELQAVLPECVKQESTGIYTIDADPLIWYLVNAVKELKAEVDSLKQQLGK
jgi:hypothetical protein